MEASRGLSLLVACLLLTIFVAGCLDEDDENGPPVAKAAVEGNDDPLEKGKLYTFNAKGSSDPDGDDLTYQWDFDESDRADDVNRKGKTVKWTFYDTGDYTITMTVSDGELEDTAELEVKVIKPPGVLEADLTTADDTRKVLHRGQEAEVELDGSNSENTEGGKEKIEKYEWDLSYDYQIGFEPDKDTDTEDTYTHDFPSGRYYTALRITNNTDHTDVSDLLLLEYNFNSSESGIIDNDNTPQEYVLPVNTLGVSMIRIELQYDAGGAHDNDLDLHLFNESGEEVATNDTHDTGDRQQSNVIELYRSDPNHNKWFDDEWELGDWTVEVEHQRSTFGEAEYDLFLDVYYY